MTIGSYELDSIVTGDARELAAALPDESVDLVFTDPPYPREFLPLYGWLAEVAARVLKPGGSCLAMCGQSYLPDIYAVMGKHLTYHWTINLNTPGAQAVTVWPRKVITFWKPVLWFQKGAYGGAFESDIVTSQANDKRFHKWGQSESSCAALLAKFPSATVFDPFCGGGTVPAVCKMLGRHYLAFEIDPVTAEKARERIHNTQPPLFVLEPAQASMFEVAA